MPDTAAINELPFIDPTAGGNRAQIALAPRPMDLAGKVVGLLDNTKEQADVILATVADILRGNADFDRVIFCTFGAEVTDAYAAALADYR